MRTPACVSRWKTPSVIASSNSWLGKVRLACLRYSSNAASLSLFCSCGERGTFDKKDANVELLFSPVSPLFKKASKKKGDDHSSCCSGVAASYNWGKLTCSAICCL